MVPAGQSPETYDPTPQQMIKVGQSVAHLKIGYIGFETAWMDNIVKNNPNLKVFDLSEGIAVIDNPDAENARGARSRRRRSMDTTTVISTPNRSPYLELSCRSQSSSLEYPAGVYRPRQGEYQVLLRQLQHLLAEIEKTEATINQLLEGLSNRTFIIYHPALSYFAA